MTRESVASISLVRNDALASPANPSTDLAAARGLLFVAAATADALACSAPGQMGVGHFEMVAETIEDRISAAVGLIESARAAASFPKQNQAIERAYQKAAQAHAVSAILARDIDDWRKTNHPQLAARAVQGLIDAACEHCETAHGASCG